MRSTWRLLTLAVVGLTASEVIAQSSSNAAMGSAGASGGVPGASAVAGAQGANSRGAAEGGGPNLSPVIPSGSRNAPANAGATQFNDRGGMFAAPNTTVGNLSSTPSARQRFGNRSSMRGADRGDVQPNRTYRSDIGAWQVIGPMQPGNESVYYPQNVMGPGAQTSPLAYDAGQYDAASMNGANRQFAAPSAASSSARSNSLVPAGAAPPIRDGDGSTPLMWSAGVQRPALGVSMAAGFTGSGAQVSRIGRNSPAAQAGLRRGDVLTSVNGLGVYSHADVVAAMESVPPSGSIEIIVWRNGQSVPLTVNFAPVAHSQTRAAADFDPSRTSAAESRAERLTRIESLMSEVQSELQQLRVNEAGR